MSKKGKIIFGVITIVFTFLGSIMGVYYGAGGERNVISTFFLMCAPTMTMLCVITLLRGNK